MQIVKNNPAKQRQFFSLAHTLTQSLALFFIYKCN